MHRERTRKLISILMESPLYMTLTVRERDALLSRLTESYPFLSDDSDNEPETGHGSSRGDLPEVMPMEM